MIDPSLRPSFLFDDVEWDPFDIFGIWRASNCRHFSDLLKQQGGRKSNRLIFLIRPTK